jgi:hypothetical protein
MPTLKQCFDDYCEYAQKKYGKASGDMAGLGRYLMMEQGYRAYRNGQDINLAQLAELDDAELAELVFDQFILTKSRA